MDELAAQARLRLMSEGVTRYVWKIGDAEILIEVEGDRVKVNGEIVEPVAAIEAATKRRSTQGSDLS